MTGNYIAINPWVVVLSVSIILIWILRLARSQDDMRGRLNALEFNRNLDTGIYNRLGRQLTDWIGVVDKLGKAVRTLEDAADGGKRDPVRRELTKLKGKLSDLAETVEHLCAGVVKLEDASAKNQLRISATWSKCLDAIEGLKDTIYCMIEPDDATSAAPKVQLDHKRMMEEWRDVDAEVRARMQEKREAAEAKPAEWPADLPPGEAEPRTVQADQTEGAPARALEESPAEPTAGKTAGEWEGGLTRYVVGPDGKLIRARQE